MRSALIIAALLALTGAGAPAAQQMPPPPHPPVAFDRDVRTWVVPALRTWSPAAGTFHIERGARVVVNGPAGEMQTIAADLARDLRSISGLEVAIASGDVRDGDIALTLRPGEMLPAEGYRLAISARVSVEAATPAGLRYGTQSLLQMLRRSDDRRALPEGQAEDWPDQPRRAMFVDVGRKFYEVTELDDLMRQMAWMKLNTLGLHFTDWPAFRLRSEKFPGLADRQAYDRADVVHLEATARRYGITIIPEIDLPAHATALIRYKPSLAFRCESMRQSEWLTRSAQGKAKSLAWTVDITRKENRQFLQSLLREFVPWFSGPYFHIGGDEYQYDVDKNRCPELLAYVKAKGLTYPGDVFVDWINETDGFVHSLGKQTAMWSWWRFKDDKTSIEPNKDILIYAWNAPRQADMLAKGYHMIVTPEDRLYVVPGIENWDGSGYGLVDKDRVYRSMPFPRNPTIEGYMLALWADAAESSTDRMMLGRAWEPMAIVAERTWAGAGSATLDGFLDRLNRTSSAPR